MFVFSFILIISLLYICFTYEKIRSKYFFIAANCLFLIGFLSLQNRPRKKRLLFEQNSNNNLSCVFPLCSFLLVFPTEEREMNIAFGV